MGSGLGSGLEFGLGLELGCLCICAHLRCMQTCLLVPAPPNCRIPLQGWLGSGLGVGLG